MKNFMVKFIGGMGLLVLWTHSVNAQWVSTNSPGAVYSLAVNDSAIFAGTQGAGVWRTPLSGPRVGVRDIPLREVLNQVNLRISTPNLTNPDATIEFSLPQSGHVTVTLFNLSGHEIASLVDDYLGQGSHSVTWNTRNLAAGSYTVRLRAGSNTGVKSVPIFK